MIDYNYLIIANNLQTRNFKRTIKRLHVNFNFKIEE